MPYTAKDIQEHGLQLDLSHQHVTLLRAFKPGSRHWLESQCGTKLTDEMWAKIKQFGYPLAAFLIEGFTWELACVIEGQSDVTKMLKRLLAQPEIENALTKTELMLLKMYVVVFVNKESWEDKILVEPATGSKYTE
ncbi:MAG: hypothetical protein AB8H12_07100 [Lewinella sp.]